METYLVGGAVRDEYMGLKPKDRDHVVIGATPAQMLKAGYEEVGKDFAVFLHPKTKEEHALARTLRKSAGGPASFAQDLENVTLEEDLGRRDLTINSMAKDESGLVIDPYGGRADIDKKILRHTSAAFREDPLRVLRTARFLAQLGPDWTIAPETRSLMHEMVVAGEVDHVPADRTWVEIEKGLKTPHPGLMLLVMRELGLLDRPAFGAYAGASRPDVDGLQAAVEAGAGVEVRFALAVPGLAPIAIMSAARIPVHVRDVALAFRAGLAVGLEDFAQMDAEGRLKVLESVDAVRQKDRLVHVLSALDCFTGRQVASCSVVAAAAAVRAINQREVIGTEKDPQTIQERIRAARIDAISLATKRPAPAP